MFMWKIKIFVFLRISKHNKIKNFKILHFQMLCYFETLKIFIIQNFTEFYNIVILIYNYSKFQKYHRLDIEYLAFLARN